SATAQPGELLLQLFKEIPAQSSSSARAESEVRAPTAPVTPSVEANLAHKQKLDCALQLARTVSLDFNNALTSILGHTSLVLSQMEPSHPWRNSLVEVEKGAGKAAEIAHQLAAFSRTEKDLHAVSATNLNTVLRRAVETFQRSHPSAIAWTLDFESRIYSAKFDEAKVQQ